MLRGHGEEFSPMRACVKGRQFPFDGWQQCADRGPILLPSEMNGDGGLIAAGAHPEIVGGDGPNLGNHQEWSDLVAQALHREYGFHGILAGNEKLGLQFLACTGRETHLEMWKTIVPGPRHAHLFGTVFGRKFGDGVKIFFSQCGAEEFRLGAISRLTCDAAFQPDFVDALLLPVGKQADAVGAGLDGVEMILHLAERKIFIDILAHEESRLKVESYFCDDTEIAEAKHGTEKE